MKPHMHLSLSLLIATLPMALALPLSAQQATPSDTGELDKASAEQAFKQRPYSPYVGRNFPTRPLFGDTHLHTSFSFDAGAFNARLVPRGLSWGIGAAYLHGDSLGANRRSILPVALGGRGDLVGSYKDIGLFFLSAHANWKF